MTAPSYLIRTLTLATLSALVVTGCGQQSEESAPVVPSDGGSATAVASASAEVSGEGSAEVSPTAEQAQNYSGGSKAPEGEYRPADELGPAQNVPVPVKPEGMNVETDEGLEKFLGYWNDSVNYGVQTGDFTRAYSLVSESFEIDIEFYVWAEEIYRRGGWIVGARREAIIGEGLLISHGDGVYTWGGNLNVEDMQPYLDGPGSISDGSESIDRGIYFECVFKDGRWYINGVGAIEE